MEVYKFDDIRLMFSEMDPITQKDLSDLEEIFTDLSDAENKILDINVSKGIPKSHMGIFSILKSSISNGFLELGQLSELLLGERKDRTIDTKISNEIIGLIKDNIISIVIRIKFENPELKNLKDCIDRSCIYANLDFLHKCKMYDNGITQDVYFLKNKKEIENICKKLPIFNE